VGKVKFVGIDTSNKQPVVKGSAVTVDKVAIGATPVERDYPDDQTYQVKFEPTADYGIEQPDVELHLPAGDTLHVCEGLFHRRLKFDRPPTNLWAGQTFNVSGSGHPGAHLILECNWNRNLTLTVPPDGKWRANGSLPAEPGDYVISGFSLSDREVNLPITVKKKP
jgi:hypothetical protein